MKVFISSLIGGFEDFRAAAKAATLNLRHEPVMAEDFGAKPDSPQIACLQGLRSSDLVVLILGSRYGVVQGSSGVSPTHEEYLEAKGRKPILMFVQGGVERDDQQSQFVSDAGEWQGGNYRATFSTPEQLKDLVTRALHDYQLSISSGPLDVAELTAVAGSLLPTARANNQMSAPTLRLAMAAGPLQRLLRPAELEAPELLEAIHQRALFGAPKVFLPSKGMQSGIEGAALFLDQERGARIQVDERGAIALRLPLDPSDARRKNGFGMLAVIEEDVLRELGAGIALCAWLLDRIDPTRRATHVALVATIEASDHMGWRTQAEQDASPNSGTMRMGSASKFPRVDVDRPRAALSFQAKELAEDIMVPLRRQMKA